MNIKANKIENQLEKFIFGTRAKYLSVWYSRKERSIYRKAVKESDTKTLRKLCKCHENDLKNGSRCPACQLIKLREENKFMPMRRPKKYTKKFLK